MPYTSYYSGGQRLTPQQYQAQTTARPRSSYSPSGVPQLYEQRYGESNALLNQLSDQQFQDLLARYRGVQSQAQQSVVGRGLAASTILPSLQAGIMRSQQADTRLLNDQLLRERLGIMGQYTQGQAGAMDSDAARRQQAALAAQQMGQQQNQFASQMSYDVSRLNSRSGASRGYVPKTGMTSRFTGQVNSYPGSYLSLQRRYT